MRTRPAGSAVRDIVINDAIKAGKIPESRRAEYERLWATNQRGATKLLCAPVEEGGLAPGIVPAWDRPTAASSADAYDDSFLSPRERERIAAMHGQAPAPRAPAKVKATGATPPQQEIGRGDLDMYPVGWLNEAERAVVAAGGSQPAAQIGGEAPGGRPAAR